MAFDFIGELDSLLGNLFGGGSSVGTVDPSQWLDPGGLTPMGFNPLDPTTAAASVPSGGSWASWLPMLSNMLGVGYEGYLGYNQMNAQQGAYDTWKQAQQRLLAQAQGMQPGIQADWQTLWQQAQQNAALQRQLAQRVMNPAAMGQAAVAASQPLNAALVNAILPQANLNVAEHGMTQAPGAVASATANALAPYEQSNLAQGVNLSTDFGPVTGLPTMGAPPNFMSTLNAISGFTPSTTTVPPDMLQTLSNFMNAARGPYSLPSGVNY